MKADFIITVHEARKPLAVRVKVYDNPVNLRRAIVRYTNKFNTRKKHKSKLSDFSDVLGICHRFHMESDPVCAIVRVSEPNLGIGLISHELTHAAVEMWNIHHKFEDVPLNDTNDEWFCWVLGELVRQTTVKFIEKGIYT
jgi:hypothetical protein